MQYIEDDDEYYGNEEVPYVWDENHEDLEGKDPDDVSDLQEDDEEGYES